MTLPANPALWALVAIALLVVALIARTVSGRRRAAREREWFHGGSGARRAVAVSPRRNGQDAGAHGTPLDPTDRERVARLWAGVQSRFVDDPRGAVVQADQVVSEVMRVRGYSEAVEFEHRAADVSANHPHLAEHYRVASEIVRREMDHQPVSTEELRTALLRYRALVDGLLGPQGVRRFDRRT